MTRGLAEMTKLLKTHKLCWDVVEAWHKVEAQSFRSDLDSQSRRVVWGQKCVVISFLINCCLSSISQTRDNHKYTVLSLHTQVEFFTFLAIFQRILIYFNYFLRTKSSIITLMAVQGLAYILLSHLHKTRTLFTHG